MFPSADDDRPAGPSKDAGFFPKTPSLVGDARRAEEEDDDEPIEPVEVRRLLSLAIAAFAALLAIGLIFGAQTSGPGQARLPYATVVLGVQLLFVLAWTMATRPPALPVVATVAVGTALAADAAAVMPTIAGVRPLLWVALGGFLAGVVGQLFRAQDRARVRESLGSTLLIVLGVVALATLIVLTRKPAGTQAIVVCLGAAGVALVVARALDSVFAWPRFEPQVPRGGLGVVLGTMIGTAVAAVIGRYQVGFDPGSAAIVGLVAAGAASLVDLATDYSEAGRQLAGDAPTMWIARHMQGPLGGFALAAPAAYLMSVMFLT
ncbi:hypothetical protein [Catenuloplanes atrovinosus]|uniref:Peptidoglycan/LPS O-acetylase OafA/YrhL n=1 Tax=Catenuloplanes atrovinosus TaxID=137266 RepID=A0AAE4CDI3_9ACTN|nr:hypothetical protein [Catenuloplanes atrovinosus]MDR7280437.1 peptidoglycan/LPS O-acetylase OafA/YrhL [Catenuloplanes atrovinosus]